MKRLVIGGSGVLLAAALVSAAQQTAPPQFRSSVDLVHLDVSVLDRDRRPVRGLTATDFEVFEEGRPQTVQAFSAVDLPDPEPAPVAWMRDVAPDVKRNTEIVDRRLVVIVMDDGSIPPDQTMIKSAREIARQAVDRLGPGDLATVVFTRDNRNAQEFTNDRARLLKAIDAFDYGGRNIGFSGGIPMPPGILLAESNALYGTVGTLAHAAEILSAVPQRRKALIYVGVGLPASGESAGEIVSIGSTDNSPEVGAMHRQLFVRMQDIYRKAQLANVNIYTVSPAGVGGMEQFIQSERWKGKFVPPYETANNYFDFLTGVAENTGGRAFPDRNEFGTALTSIFQENGSYYLLGYQPPNPAADGKHRRVEVRVNRPGLIVRTRSGYYNAKARDEKAEAAAPLTAAMSGLLPKADVPLDVMAAPFAIPGKNDAGVAVVLTVHEDLPERPSRTVKEVDLQMTAFTQEGVRKASSSMKTRVTLRPGPAGRAEYEVLSQITLRPGRYQLRLSANTGTKAGSVYYDIDIPDFWARPLSMSGLMLTSEPRPVSSATDPIRTFVPFSPTARREFMATDKVTAFARVYQGGRDPVASTTVTVRITDATGALRLNRTELLTAGDVGGGRGSRPPFGSAETSLADRTIDFRMDLPLKTLPAGQYLLTLQATTSRGEARRDIRFTVR